MKYLAVALAVLVVLPSCSLAQGKPGQEQSHSGGHMGHAAIMAGGSTVPTGAGQAAFAAIQEIVAILMADPETDWSRVNIEALRQHLIDMDNVTLRSKVIAEEIDGGARFTITSEDPATAASIARMTRAHAVTMTGVEGWSLEFVETPGGAELTATGDAARIRALGYIGIMTVGMHHQTHHLAIARGEAPH